MVVKTHRKDKPDTMEVYGHYGASEDVERIKSGEYKSVDFMIGREADLKELTANMVGFGAGRSQRVIIDYDKDYGWFIARRIPMEYGGEKDAEMKEEEKWNIIGRLKVGREQGWK